MDIWIIWLVAACVLGVGEMHQGGFYLAPFALGAALAAIVSLLGVGALLTAVVFVARVGDRVRDAAPGRPPPPPAAAVDPHRRGGAGRASARSCSSGSPTTRASAA